MVRMQVAGLTLDDATKAPILILRQEDSTEVLPIWIGAMEAMAISIVLNEVAVPRPLTHDLLLSTLDLLGGTLTGIEIVDLEGGTYFAELLLATADGVQRMDCRPSDAIALALRADVPVMVAQKVLDAAAVDQLRPTGEDPAVLRRPEDATYEMAKHGDDDTTQSAAAPVDEDAPEADEDTLSELLRNLEPETKNKM